jgi:protoporphyrinogen oxidase
MDTATVILGGGISGIAANYFLGKENATIYEQKGSWGGLCDNFSIGDFKFDTGIHLSFTNFKEVRAVFDKVPYYTYQPEPVNYYKGNWLKQPIQNNLFPLPAEEKVKALKDYIYKPNQSDNYESYKSWLYSKYGGYITENFFLPYTEKYWCEKAENMETSWIKNRLYIPEIDEVLYGAMSEKTPNRYYAQEMRYPKLGGYKAFLEPMVPKVNLKLNKKAVMIDIKNKLIEFEDGSKVFYENLISSLPLPELIKLIKDVPLEVKQASGNLIATSLTLISIGFNVPQDETKSIWFYIYDDDLLPARAYYPCLKSKQNTPASQSSIQFEIYYSKHKPINSDKETLTEHLIHVIEKLNINCRRNVLFIDIKDIPYANVIFDKRLSYNRNLVRQYLEKIGIQSIGRFGEWDYLWSDQSFMSGKKAAESLLKIYSSQDLGGGVK